MRRLLPTLLLLPVPALAHTGAGPVSGFVAGFSHPLGGADHLMAMLAVGLLAGLLGGRAILALPAAFLGGMALGGGLGFAGLMLPEVEAVIVASVIVLGALVALAARPPVALLSALAALSGLFHGHAHGTEMLAGTDVLSHAAGFLLSTAGLHLLGVAFGTLRAPPARMLARTAGAAMVVAMLASVTLA